MKIYYPKSHYKPRRRFVFPLLRPFTKTNNFTDAKRINLYGLSAKDYEFTDTIEDADLAILTMAWNFYVNNNQIAMAVDFIKDCGALGKKVLVINGGDFGMRVPNFENVIILRFSGYKSRFSENEFVIPPMIKDPLTTYFNTNIISKRAYSTKATIGFCGQANSSRFNAAKEILNTIRRNIKFKMGISLNEPQQVISTTLLRASVLNTLQKSTKVMSNFILRKKYRAGVLDNKETHKTTREFYNNIRNSDYVVCVRGAGNFSIRFYEVLAMGRIPIFINTNCALPFDEELDWKKHVVWVEYKDRSLVAEKVAEFHNSLSEKDFIDLQLSNRKLWEEHLTLHGFFKKFLIQI